MVVMMWLSFERLPREAFFSTGIPCSIASGGLGSSVSGCRRLLAVVLDFLEYLLPLGCKIDFRFLGMLKSISSPSSEETGSTRSRGIALFA